MAVKRCEENQTQKEKMLSLRDYQEKAVQLSREAIQQGNRKVILAMPTGSGKSIVMFRIAQSSIQNGHKVLILMHRRQLVTQLVKTFTKNGIDCGMIMAKYESKLSASCQVATIQTYNRRMQLSDNNAVSFFVNAGLVMIDEGHHTLSATYQRALAKYPDVPVIAVTATPTLSSGVGMGNYFDSIVQPVSVQELIDGGYLVPGIYYGPSPPDLSKIKIIAGDYEKKTLGEAMTKPKIVGDVIENWQKLAGGKQTMVFAVNVAHSKALQEAFERVGVVAVHLDAYSDDAEREKVLSDFKLKSVQVIINVGLFTEGTDIPEIECVSLARPVKSLGALLQMVGRGARPHPGKEDFIVIDHGGMVADLGFYEDEIKWSLSGKKITAKKKIVREKEKKIRTCDMCMTLFTGSTCPRCGMKIKEYKKLIAAESAELISIGKKKKPKVTMEDKRKFFAQLDYHRRLRGYKQGWTGWKYKEKFGVWPRKMDNVTPLPPDAGFKNWLTYQNIKNAKSNQSSYESTKNDLCKWRAKCAD